MCQEARRQAQGQTIKYSSSFVLIVFFSCITLPNFSSSVYILSSYGFFSSSTQPVALSFGIQKELLQSFGWCIIWGTWHLTVFQFFSSRRVSLRYVPGQQNVRRILQSPRDRQAVNEEHEPKTHTDLGSVYLKYRERGRREQKKKHWEILW